MESFASRSLPSVYNLDAWFGSETRPSPTTCGLWAVLEVGEPRLDPAVCGRDIELDGFLAGIEEVFGLAAADEGLAGDPGADELGLAGDEGADGVGVFGLDSLRFPDSPLLLPSAPFNDPCRSLLEVNDFPRVDSSPFFGSALSFARL